MSELLSVHLKLSQHWFIGYACHCVLSCVQLFVTPDFPGGSDSKDSTCSVGDLGLIPGLGRSSGGKHGNLPQYSRLENPHTGEPGRLQSMGVQRVRHDWATTWLFYYLDCSPPGSSVHGIIPEWVAISSSRGSSWPRDRTCASCVSCMGRRILYHWATWEVTFKISYTPIKNIKFKKKCQETSLVVQWLGLCVPNAGGLGFHPWLGNLTPHATTKTWHSKINK